MNHESAEEAKPDNSPTLQFLLAHALAYIRPSSELRPHGYTGERGADEWRQLTVTHMFVIWHISEPAVGRATVRGRNDRKAGNRTFSPILILQAGHRCSSLK